MDWPNAGASASFTLTGITVLKTSSPYRLRISCSIVELSVVLWSYMVQKTPPICAFRFTFLMSLMVVSNTLFLKGDNKRGDADGAVFWEAVPRSRVWLGG